MEYSLAAQGDPDTEQQRLARIERYQDGPTVRTLTELGVGPGWTCLDVGAGAGSIATWLAAKVAPNGRVTATDLDITALQQRCGATVDVRRHDVRVDPLPADSYDLVHTRLVLIHLPEREHVLDRLIGAVRPGGLVVVGDIDFTAVLAPDEPLYERVHAAFLDTVTELSWKPDLGSSLPDLLTRHGLRSVEAEWFRSRHHGGSAVPAILAMTLRRLQSQLLGSGRVSEDELARCLDRMQTPDFAVDGPQICTAWGRR